MNRKIQLILILLLVTGSVSLFAGNKPLSLKESEPADEAVNIAIDSEITLEFSNNVVNMKVSEHNAECISMTDAAGEPVDVEIVFPDDQMEPEKKRTVHVIPAGPLAKGTTYTVIIAREMKSKNGSFLGEEARISFTTAP